MFIYMLRAIFFDFYGVWVPDQFNQLISDTAKYEPGIADELQRFTEQYYVGHINLEGLVNNIKLKLNKPGLVVSDFELHESSISSEAIKFIQYLHGHFVKVGILAKLGQREYEILHNLDTQYKLFENITSTYNLKLPLLTKEVFVEAFNKIGEPRDSCIIVTGNTEYAEYAKKLGITILLYEGFPKLRNAMIKLLESG